MSDFIREYMQYHPVRTQRGLEIFTGLSPWLLITFLIIGSFVFPVVVAYFVIAFNVFWLYKSAQMTLGIVVGYLNLRATQKVDWLAKLENDEKTKHEFKKVVHVIIIPNVAEPNEILLRNVRSLSEQNFPLKQVYVVLAMEDREGEPARNRSALIKKELKNKFAGIIDTYHILTPGETIGKHSNNTFAARYAKKYLTETKKISIENIIATTCDVDLVFHKEFFALLTYRFLTSNKRFNQFFQTALLAYNNIGRLPFLTRIPNIVGSINNLAVLSKPRTRIMNYSTYSLSLKLLDFVGYWDTDVIPEDWHLNLKAYFATDGKIEVVPLFLPSYLDAAESTSRWKAYKNYYEQVKRWAWGAVDIPYALKMLFSDRKIPFFNKFLKVSVALEQHFLWGTSWFLITIGALIPTVLNPTFARTTLGFNLSRVSGFILTLCLLGVIAIAIVDVLLDPGKKRKFLTFLHPFTYLQWLVMPVAGLVFGALPGLESQTRLMLGKYIGYKVTEKVADKKGPLA